MNPRPRPAVFMLFLLSALTLLPLWGWGAPALAAPPAPWSGKVVKVENGSSLDIQHGGQVERLHLAGVAAPHLNQPWGDRAKQFASEGVLGQTVTVEPQGQDQKRRSMVTVIMPDGRDLGAEMIKEGLAWHHRRTSKNPLLADLEKDARAERRGLWGDPQPTPPWEWSGRPSGPDAPEEEPPPRKSKKRRN